MVLNSESGLYGSCVPAGCGLVPRAGSWGRFLGNHEERNLIGTDHPQLSKTSEIKEAPCSVQYLIFSSLFTVKELHAVKEQLELWFLHKRSIPGPNPPAAAGSRSRSSMRSSQRSALTSMSTRGAPADPGWQKKSSTAFIGQEV